MTVTLKNKNYEAVIDTKGAQLLSFKNPDGTEFIWQGDKKYWGGRAPILFPIVGGLRAGKTYIDSVEYHMERHGFAKKSEFNIEKQTNESVTLTLSSNEETMKVYPFEFVFSVIFTLKSNTLTTAFIIKNKDEKKMPFAVGGHPAIKCPINENEVFEDYIAEFPNKENIECPTVIMETGLIDFDKRFPVLVDSNTISMEHSLFYQDALVFDSLKSTSCKLYNPKSGYGAEISFEGFPMFGIWSAVNDAPFICLEPWTGCATAESEDDNFENKRSLIWLEPQNECHKSFSLKIYG